MPAGEIRLRQSELSKSQTESRIDSRNWHFIFAHQYANYFGDTYTRYLCIYVYMYISTARLCNLISCWWIPRGNGECWSSSSLILILFYGLKCKTKLLTFLASAWTCDSVACWPYGIGTLDLLTRFLFCLLIGPETIYTYIYMHMCVGVLFGWRLLYLPFSSI